MSWVATSRHACGVQRHLECGVLMVFLFFRAPRGSLNGSSLKAPPLGLVLMTYETSFSHLGSVHVPTGAPTVIAGLGPERC